MIWICKNCNKKFFPKHPNWFESRFRKFCSKSCGTSFTVRGKKGSDHPHWQGGFDKLAYAKQWRKDHPTQVKAHRTVYIAIRGRKLVRQPCEACQESSIFSEAHHANYEKPLKVTWLCRECHVKEHVKIKELAYAS